ncbi:primosomal protein [Psychromonas sp. psych-6C06]|uniref:primosomal replication protein PriC n=1 Tax=Psychromonas sp. psych-6C06 TaxID=2058089 RepID=UPI000C344E28|nr:primosomal replication protein PriC [Psychromonas sp. psych-6C06]PKF60688.1 primosomal protein [Psychromonas sp. psych-6C06]
MVQLNQHSIAPLKVQLKALKVRCQQIDSQLTQTENRCFVFEAHQFSKRSLTLLGYLEQIEQTLRSLQTSIDKNRPDLLIKIECEQFVIQFQLLLQLVQSIEQGKGDLLYKSYSSPKEKIFQQLQKQSEYEHRLLTMIAEQEEILASDPNCERGYIKEKIEALKVRFHKCNTFTQKLEFQLEEINDE